MHIVYQALCNVTHLLTYFFPVHYVGFLNVNFLLFFTQLVENTLDNYLIFNLSKIILYFLKIIKNLLKYFYVYENILENRTYFLKYQIN